MSQPSLTLETILLDKLLRSYSGSKSARHSQYTDATDMYTKFDRNVLKWPADPSEFNANLLLDYRDERNRSTELSETKRSTDIAFPRPVIWERKRAKVVEGEHGPRSDDLEDESDEEEEEAELFLSGEEDFVDDVDDLVLDDDPDIVNALRKKASPLVPMEHSLELLGELKSDLSIEDELCKSVIASNTARLLGQLLDECTKAWLSLGGADGKLVAGDFDFVLAVAQSRVPELRHVLDRAKERYSIANELLPYNHGTDT